MNHPFLTNPDGTIQVRNAQFHRNNTVECEVNHKEYGWIPFLATPYDEIEYGRVLYRELTEDRASEIAPLDLEVLKEQDAFIIRAQRNSLLEYSDWTQLPDVPTSVKNTWAVYRQELRDITTQPTFPDEVIWPTKPQ